MSVPVGPSHFVDVYNVSYNGVSIYSVSNIRINRQRTVLKGEDNNKLRPVSNHTVRIAETITFESEDIYALTQLESVTGAHNLTFNWLPASSTLTTDPLVAQLVTVKNVVIENIGSDAMSKALGKFSVSGSVLETSDDTDPVVFAAAS